jgi:hypothetical protein
MDLVEIIQPLSKEKIFANIATGECFWDPPSGANVYEIFAFLNGCLCKLILILCVPCPLTYSDKSVS